MGSEMCIRDRFRTVKSKNFFRKKQTKLLKAYALGKVKKAEKIRQGLLISNTVHVNRSGFK